MTNDQHEKNKEFSITLLKEIEEKLRTYSEDDSTLHISVILQLTNMLTSILFGNTIINMKLNKSNEKEIKEKVEILRTFFINSIDHAIEMGSTFEVDPNK